MTSGGRKGGGRWAARLVHSWREELHMHLRRHHVRARAERRARARRARVGRGREQHLTGQAGGGAGEMPGEMRLRCR